MKRSQKVEYEVTSLGTTQVTSLGTSAVTSLISPACFALLQFALFSRICSSLGHLAEGVHQQLFTVCVANYDNTQREWERGDRGSRGHRHPESFAAFLYSRTVLFASVLWMQSTAFHSNSFDLISFISNKNSTGHLHTCSTFFSGTLWNFSLLFRFMNAPFGLGPFVISALQLQANNSRIQIAAKEGKGF